MVLLSNPNIIAEWNGPLSALISIDNIFAGEDTSSSSKRTVNFMSYELATLCSDLDQDQIFAQLNTYFFQHKKFRVSSDPIFIKNVLQERKGAGLTIALLYMHLAQSVGLTLKVIHWPLHTILKWNCNGESRFVDLVKQGQILTEEEILLVINKHKDQVRTLSLNEALVQYLEYISKLYRQEQSLDLLHRTLNLMLNLEPENTRVLAERALLRKNLGLLKEALQDFKRYFSFTDRSTSPQELSAAYSDLLNSVET